MGCNNNACQPCANDCYHEQQHQHAHMGGGCGRNDQWMEYARAYVRTQRYENVYDAKQALCRGTAFQALDMPCW